MDVVPSFAEWLVAGPRGTYVAERRFRPGVSTGLLRVAQPAGTFPCPPSDDIGIAYILGGSCRAEINIGAGAFQERLAPGQVYVTPPRTPNCFELDGRHEFLSCTIPSSIAMPIVREASAGALSDLGPLHSSSHADRGVRDLFLRLWAAGVEDGPASRVFMDGLTQALVAALVRLAMPARPPVRATPLPGWRLKRAQAILGDRLDEELELSDVAAAVGLSTFHFARGFKASTGLPPHAWRNQRRIGRVQALLTGSDRPVAEIAAECGFCSQAHLTNAFRKATGTTPAAWRRERQA